MVRIMHGGKNRFGSNGSIRECSKVAQATAKDAASLAETTMQQPAAMSSSRVDVWACRHVKPSRVGFFQSNPFSQQQSLLTNKTATIQRNKTLQYFKNKI
jgi:hypothetical protein